MSIDGVSDIIGMIILEKIKTSINTNTFFTIKHTSINNIYKYHEETDRGAIIVSVG